MWGGVQARWDRLEDWLRNEPIPDLYKSELRDAFEDLGRLSDADWAEIDTADEQDWTDARADLSDLISEPEWGNNIGDLTEVGSVGKSSTVKTSGR